MLDFLSEGDKGAEEAPKEEALEASDEGDDESEQEAAPEARPEEPAAKKSRNQRLKAQRDAASAEAAEHKKNAVEALSFANHWRAHALALEKEFKRHIDSGAIKIDPRDGELFLARREKERQALETHTRAEVEKIDAEHAQKAQQSELVAEFRTEAKALVKKHPGLEARQILLAYAMADEAGMGLTLEQVAANLARQATPKTSPAAEQLKTNRAAPKPLRVGKTAVPNYGNSTEDMEAFLLSRGK